MAWQHRVREIANPLISGMRVLLVGAHPDDETIGAGRLAAGHDGPVRAVVLSAGESCVVDPALDPAVLMRRRLGEWRSAAQLMGTEPLETQRWADSQLTVHEAAMTDLLVDLARGADAVLGTWRHDPHPDHAATGRACAAAADAAGIVLVEYLVWAPYWLEPADVAVLDYRVCSVRTDPASTRARERALAGYVSQTTPLLPGIEPVVPPEMLARHDRQLVAVPGA